MSRSMAAPAVTILNVDPGGNRPIVAIGPSRSADAFCATAMISPVEGLMTTIMACLPVVSTAFWAAFCTERSRLMVTDGAGSPATSCSTSTSTPFWLTVTTRHPAVPSSSSETAVLTWLTRAGANVSSVGTISGWGVITTPGSAPMAPATASWSTCRNVIRLNGLFFELASSASRCGSSVLSKRCRAPTTARAVGISSTPAARASRAKWYRYPGTRTSVPPRSLTEARRGASARRASVWFSPSLGCTPVALHRTSQFPSSRTMLSCPS